MPANRLTHLSRPTILQLNIKSKQDYGSITSYRRAGGTRYPIKGHLEFSKSERKTSDRWSTPIAIAVNIFADFTVAEFATAFQNTKSGKAPGPDSICPKLIIHAGAPLISWLCGFISSCLHHLKISKVWKRPLVVAIPKPLKLKEDPKSYCPISLLNCFSIRSSKSLSKPMSNPFLIHYSLPSRLDFGVGDQPWINQFCCPKTLRTTLNQKEKLVPCLWI